MNEQPQPSYNYAGFGRRFLAYGVDSVILILLSIIGYVLVGKNYFDQFSAEALAGQSPSNTIGLAIAFVISLIYSTIFWVNFDGATPGKKLMAIKIINTDGSAVSYPAAIVRYVGTWVSAFVFCLGYLWVAFDGKKQGWHDKIAGTFVVNTDAQPRTVLAVLINFIFYIGMLGLFSYVVYVGFQQAIKEENLDLNELMSVQQMGPEAKLHYDKSATLFDQMRAEASPDKVKTLNDQNISELKQALNIEPNNAAIWFQLGNAYSWLSTSGTVDDELAAYRKADELAPNTASYITNVGLALVSMQKYDEAVLELQKALRLNDRDGYTALGLARAYAGLKINNSARDYYQKAIDIFTKENSDGSFDSYILQAQKEMAQLP